MAQATKTEMSAVEAMLSRHSVRKYQKGVTIPQNELNEILKLAASAPSAWNLQHWRFLVIQEQENKERLLPIAYNQQQVVDSSVTVAILGDLEADKVAEKVYEPAVESGAMPKQAYETMIQNIKGAYANNPTIGRDSALLNAGFAGMQLMLAAKAFGYDTVPMGGFDPEALKKEFNIPDRYIPVMLVSIGKAAAEAHATGRFSLDELVIEESF